MGSLFLQEANSDTFDITTIKKHSGIINDSLVPLSVKCLVIYNRVNTFLFY